MLFCFTDDFEDQSKFLFDQKLLRGNRFVLYQDVCTFNSMVPLSAFCNKYSADEQIKVNVQIESQQ